MNNNQTIQSDNNYFEGHQPTSGLPKVSDNEFPNEDIKEPNDTSLSKDQEGSLSNGVNIGENIEPSESDNEDDYDEVPDTPDEDLTGPNYAGGEYNRDHEGGVIDEITETEDVEDADRDDEADKDINADSEVVDNRDANEADRPSYGDEGGAGSESRFPKSI